MKNAKFQFDYALGKGYGRLVDRTEGWTEGEVVTPHGIVIVYSQGNEKNRHHTSLRVVAKGRVHCCTFDKRFTKRGLVTKAKQFAKEISES